MATILFHIVQKLIDKLTVALLIRLHNVAVGTFETIRLGQGCPVEATLVSEAVVRATCTMT